MRSEREPEPELNDPRLVRDVAVEGRVAVRGVALRQSVRTVVLVIEQVERFDQPFDRPAAAEADPLLHAHVDPVNRAADEAVSRYDRAVGSEPPACDALIAQVAAVAAS